MPTGSAEGSSVVNTIDAMSASEIDSDDPWAQADIVPAEHELSPFLHKCICGSGVQRLRAKNDGISALLCEYSEVIIFR